MSINLSIDEQAVTTVCICGDPHYCADVATAEVHCLACVTLGPEDDCPGESDNAAEWPEFTEVFLPASRFGEASICSRYVLNETPHYLSLLYRGIQLFFDDLDEFQRFAQGMTELADRLAKR